MFSRTTLRTTRGYSTSGADFLSGLMKRIDNLNLELKKKKDIGNVVAPKKAQAPQPSKLANTSLTNKDHPMASNRFRERKRQEFIDARPLRPKAAVRRTRISTAGEKASKTAGAAKGSNTKGPAIGTVAGGAGSATRTRAGARFSRFNQPITTTKKLISAPLEPRITGEHFFYGKPAGMGFSLLSRVATMAKRSLLESKYPYKLPKSIIDGLETTPAISNRFILKKDYNLDINTLSLVSKAKAVVKGETEQLNTPKKLSAPQTEVRDELMRNSTLSMKQKQHIFDLCSGAKSAQDVLKTAAWK